MKVKPTLNRKAFLPVISMQQCFKYPKLVLCWLSPVSVTWSKSLLSKQIL